MHLNGLIQGWHLPEYGIARMFSAFLFVDSLEEHCHFKSRCSISLVTREMQIKVTMSYQLTSTGMDTVKQTIVSVDEEADTLEPHTLMTGM